MPRDTMITAINLRNCLQLRDYEESEKNSSLFIVTNFNKLDIAFHVDSVLGIHRVSWNNIIKPGNTVSTSEDGVSTVLLKSMGN